MGESLKVWGVQGLLIIETWGGGCGDLETGRRSMNTDLKRLASVYNILISQ